MTIRTTNLWRFAERPESTINNQTFRLEQQALPNLEEGQVLVRNLLISMDATNRLWLTERDELYVDPLQPGDSMKGFGLAQVIESTSRLFKSGDLITALTEWSDFSVLDAQTVQPFGCPPGLDLAKAFGVLSIAGPTAYHGLFHIGQPKPGETVVVTAASGAVGALAGQMAKLAGCRVVGTAGSDEKCAWLTQELGFDAAINYKKADLASALADACPAGIDVQFENVGGDILDHCLRLMNNYGRVVICGLISMYNSNNNAPGPTMFHNTIMKRLKIEGFVVLDLVDKMPKICAQLVQWMIEGKLQFRLNLSEGLDQAPAALQKIYTGANDGKVLVRLADPE